MDQAIVIDDDSPTHHQFHPPQKAPQCVNFPRPLGTVRAMRPKQVVRPCKNFIVSLVPPRVPPRVPPPLPSVEIDVSALCAAKKDEAQGAESLSLKSRSSEIERSTDGMHFPWSSRSSAADEPRPPLATGGFGFVREVGMPKTVQDADDGGDARPWTREEDYVLLFAMKTYPFCWGDVTKRLPRRSRDSCEQRWKAIRPSWTSPFKPIQPPPAPPLPSSSDHDHTAPEAKPPKRPRTDQPAIAPDADMSVNPPPSRAAVHLPSGAESEARDKRRRSGRLKPFREEKSTIHREGVGLFANRTIRAGEEIIEYAGEYIHAEQADEREALYRSQGLGSTYLFRLSNGRIIDATRKDYNEARLINHSCAPNCEPREVQVPGGRPRIYIYAIEEIAAGTELSYDYGTDTELNHSTRERCTCGAATCRGFL
ncbi:unnamed protein product [Vitrella brassicaformis CCMP3155]|uniref:Histone-lysine N-methyltransferase n=1 Tax=Vitrella brassicaformis (strain CCMP3155) TaxID=1169540 RepID=A0A0G4H740_VITBC|nr:unnamed protein product [Vitrella brassicaformis CCMP3155]|mmetsp:Transcript_33342/g.96317  ORF Transcript_33342/g.96317 Transcript_33342/m.96317 type:complete len:425 (+) Transcript_33342:51-1325(+)|eukprot:CEM39704.1 unnamed protein product [Vitrella brassicaformis CCMP3155]